MVVMRSTRRGFMAGTLAGAGALALPRLARAQAERRGGTLVVAADGEPRNLNPAIVASNGVFFVASKVIEPLAEMSYGGDGLVPRLATSWRGSADGRSATFTLRDGVTWHDGRPFTSADVAFSALEVWRKLQNLGRVIFADLEAVDTPDATTAILRFSAPTPFQLIRNALPAVTAVLPRHLYAGTDIAATLDELVNAVKNETNCTVPMSFENFRSAPRPQESVATIARYKNICGILS
jgi:peptide/nickel transport system substrate-binding protein